MFGEQQLGAAVPVRRMVVAVRVVVADRDDRPRDLLDLRGTDMSRDGPIS